MMHLPSPSTSETLSAYHAQYVAWYNGLSDRERNRHIAGWRGVGLKLGWHYSTLADVAKGRPGCITLERENRLRAQLGLSLLFIPTPPCPTCGQPHNVDAAGAPLDCHGREGQAVWRPAPVTRPSRRRVRIDVTGLSHEQRQQVAAFVASLRGGGDRTVTETGGV